MRVRKVHLRKIRTSTGRLLTAVIEGDLITIREHGRQLAIELPLSALLGRAYIEACAQRAAAEREARRAARKAARCV